MKKTNIVIAVALILLCGFGWFSAASSKVSEKNQHNTYIEQADAWVEQGLYQRAIRSYQSALQEETSVEVYTKAINAYQARMAEVTGDTLDDTADEYVAFLKQAVAACPQEEEFVRLLGQRYLEAENYTQAYSCLRGAVNNGIESEKILAMLRQAQYAWDLRGSTYSSVSAPAGAGGAYSAAKTGRWGVYDAEEGTVLPFENEYVSQLNKNGVAIVTSATDSRLIDGDGVVLGIFADKVVSAGVYADGLIAASFDGDTYSYYNEFAEKQFGGYEAAGTFQNGTAAVKQNGVWFLIDEHGEKISEDYAEIVLNCAGEYMCGSVILASDGAGSYTFYDNKWKPLASFEASEVDGMTEDGIVAFCKNGVWGFVNTTGEEVVKPQYDMARSYSNGLAAVCKNGLWGFIDPSGEQVINCQFSDALYFDALGICPVRTDMQALIEAAEAGQSTETTSDREEDANGETVKSLYQEWKLLKLKNGITEG